MTPSEPWTIDQTHRTDSPLPASTIGTLFPPEVYDAPSQQPKVRLPLRRVAIVNQRIAVSFVDELVGRWSGLLDVAAGVSLSADQRGIHMSRIARTLQRSSTDQGLAACARALARSIREAQGQIEAEVTLSGEVMVPTVTPISRLPVLNPVSVLATARVDDVDALTLGVEATTITACPCMQAYALDELARTFDLPGDKPELLLRSAPFATHSQKGRVRLTVAGPARAMEGLSLGQLYRVLGRGTSLTSELLKRPDEYELVRRAHLHPQFVEDVVREVLQAAGTLLGTFEPTLLVHVCAASYESIHGHDIEAETTIPLGSLASFEPPSAASKISDHST